MYIIFGAQLNSWPVVWGLCHYYENQR